MKTNLKTPHIYTKRTMLMFLFVIGVASIGSATIVNVNNVTTLVNAVNNGSAGDTINIAAGTYLLTSTLKPKSGMRIKGAGRASTILKPASSWNPGPATPIDPTNWTGVNTSAYFFYLGNNNGINNVTILDMTMDALKQLQGAVCGASINNLTIYNVYFHDFTFCGIRVIGGSNLVIHDSEFINMAINGMDPESGAVVFAWLSNSEFYNNEFYFATHGVYYGSGVNAGNFYGYKGRQLKNSRIHHNTIMVNFSIELPFDDISDVEVDHNYIDGWISIPKYAGGSVPPSGVAMHIHHNYDASATVLEYPRNSIEIDHNLLDNHRSEAGSMLSGWTSQSASGPTKMHDNLIKNLGRVIADVGLYNKLEFYNNSVKAPQNDGASTNELFIIDGNIDRSSFVCKDNIFDCSGHPRNLLWSGLGAGFTSIKNNTLINVTDQANYSNPATNSTRGPLEPLLFTCGALGNQFCVNQWTVSSGKCAGVTAVLDSPEKLPVTTFKIYPNPANQSVVISCPLAESVNMSIEVRDKLGKEIMQEAIVKQTDEDFQLIINTEELQNGIYFVKKIVNANQVIQKLIINH